MYYNSSNEFNDCVSHGACSLSPNVSSMNVLMFSMLCQIAYYIVKLRELGFETAKYSSDIEYLIAFSDSLKDLSELQILDLFNNQYKNLIYLKNEYNNICKVNNIVAHNIKNIIKLNKDFKLSDLLKLGEKEFISKYKNMNDNNKYSSEILINVLKSYATNLINLSEFEVFINNFAINTVIDTLNLFNSHKISYRKIKSQIDLLAQEDKNLLKKILIRKLQKFGNISKTKVSLSTRPNKAIMVSGSNLNDLSNLLTNIKNEDIDIYTNSNLLIAHAYKKFQYFKNLKGHFGNAIPYTMLDFATFPGAILLTKNESQNIEYLYRGRLFSTDKITPKGVSKIESNDFSQLINSAKQAKGFAKGQIRENKVVGYNNNELYRKIDKILSDNPKNIIILGNSDLKNNDINYFNSLLNKISNDTAIISFSYNNQTLKNMIYINLGDDYSQLFNAIRKISKKIPLNSDNLHIILTKCDINTLSNIISLKSNGAKNIYISDCPSITINPSVLSAFKKLYNIKSIDKLSI